MKANRLKALVIVGWVTLALSCSEESPFLTKEEATRIMDSVNSSRNPLDQIRNVVAIINNDIYYFDHIDNAPRRLTTSSQTKRNVKLSHDRSRIAFIDHNNHPVIIRTDDGSVAKTLTQYSGIKQMEWAKDRLTLLMLINGRVVTDGESITVRQPSASAYAAESYSMNSKGDYGHQAWRWFGAGLQYYSDDQDLDKDISSMEGEHYNYIHFYNDEGDFLLGYFDSYHGDEMRRIVCVQDYEFWPAYTWDEEYMRSPTFNRELEVLLYGTVEEGSFRVKAVYRGLSAYPDDGDYHEIMTKALNDYVSQSPVYVDWVQ